MILRSPAFRNATEIPQDYTGEGQDISPPLEWSDVPDGTREFVLICEDPDAPQAEPFVHWLIYDLSPTVSALPEGILSKEHLDAPIRADQGRNSFGNPGYGGPMPPVGHGTHHYIFTLYALNTQLGLKPGAKKAALLRAIQGHVLDSTQLIGTYKREAQRKTA